MALYKFNNLGEEVLYDGDPLLDFSSIRFLERFAFKNPKKSKKLLSRTKKKV